MCLSLACCAACSCASCAASMVPTRVVYLLMMFLSAVMAMLLRAYGHEVVVDLYSFKVGCESAFADACLGMQGVYRVSFALFVFFLSMSLLTRLAPRFNDGSWGVKFLVYFALLVLAFLTPNDVFEVYSEIARVGSVLFVVLQILILIDFAYDLHEFIVGRIVAYDEELARDGYEANLCGNKWKVLYIVACLAVFVAVMVGIILIYSQYPACGLNTFFASETILASVVLTVLSASNAVGKGLLTPLVVAAHSVFLAWGAVTSNPDTECNPGATSSDTGSVLLGFAIAALSLTWTTFRTAGAGYDFFRASQAGDDESADRTRPVPTRATSDGAKADQLELAVTSSGGTEAQASRAAARGASDAGAGDAVAESAPAPSDPTAWFFHLVMCLGGLYTAMLFTNWGSVDADSVTANPELSEQSMWVKIASQWLSYVIYAWTLVAPLCCPGRDFSDTHNSFGAP